MAQPRTELFAACAPGLEPIVADELRDISTGEIEPLDGGVRFEGGPEVMARANLWLRCAERVLLRLGRFEVRRAGDLDRRARTIPFVRYLDPTRPVLVRVTARRSAFRRDSDAARELIRAVADRLGCGVSKPEEGEEHALLLLRLEGRECTVSIDTSGELLHRRGYRQAVAKAPIRETLAAAALRICGWSGDAPLADPMCGSGTLPIEAALMARRFPPGAHRGFAFEGWPDLDPEILREARAEALAGALERSPVPIVGSDRDAGAVKASRANAERAGVADDVCWSCNALSAARPPAGSGPGLVVCNPPYGQRIGGKDLRDLYSALGNTARERFPGWSLGLITADPRLAHHAGKGVEGVGPVLPHGGAKVRVYLRRA